MLVLGLVLLALSYSLIPTLVLKFLWRKGLGEGQQVVLSFDDGPHPVYTRELLDILEENQLPANFFLVADYVEENQDLVDLILERGHTIGFHSSSHQPLLYRGPWATRRDLVGGLERMEALGYDCQLYRPAWGQVNIFSLILIKKLGLRLVLWNLMAEDWKPSSSPAYIQDKLLKNTKNGSIICLHDSREEDNFPQATLEALRTSLPQLRENFEFIRLGDYYGEEDKQ